MMFLIEHLLTIDYKSKFFILRLAILSKECRVAQSFYQLIASLGLLDS